MTTSVADAGALPVWDLTDLYQGLDDPDIDRDLKTARDQARRFQSAYQTRTGDLKARDFANAIQEYETICDQVYKVFAFAQLLQAGNVADPETGRFYQGIQERVTEISTVILFFTLEIGRMDETALQKAMKNKAVARYKPWIDGVRLYKDRQLPDQMETLLQEKSLTGRAAFVRLFDETMATMRFIMEGEKQPLDLSSVLNFLSDKDQGKRKSAAAALAKGLAGEQRVLTQITNTLAKDKQTDDKWRKYETPLSSRNLANRVEDDVVEALVTSVKSRYGDLAHRYYALKAGWFGVDQLEYWDRNAPLPGDRDRTYSWQDGKSIVLDAYAGFAPEMADIAAEFFDNNWIDAQLRAGKNSGAFSHPVVASAHPYILLNFHGRSRDVMTLAHELGHGVHQMLAREQGTLMSETPLTLAETASVFGEMLIFKSLLENETDRAAKRILLAGKVEDMMNTVVRQIAFHEFEWGVHQARQKSELSADGIGDIWMRTQGESLGPAIKLRPEYSTFWGYVPHFIHSPFYVYAYAFGDCLVNSLYDVYAGGHDGFQDKYFTMLKSGGTLGHKDLLQPFGLDATDPEFWMRGLSVISSFIDDLEAEK